MMEPTPESIRFSSSPLLRLGSALLAFAATFFFRGLLAAIAGGESALGD